MSHGSEAPLIVLAVGANGSGKSTLLEQLTMHFDSITAPDHLVPVNADEIACALKAEHPLWDDEELVHAAQREADAARDYLITHRKGFVSETVGSHPSRLEMLERAKNAGFKTIVLFVSTEDPAINLKRVQARVELGGHGVPDEKVVSRYGRVSRMARAYLAIADVFVAYDNSTDGLRRVLVKTPVGVCVDETAGEVRWLARDLL